MSEVRRSVRERKPANTFYEDAKRKIEDSLSASSHSVLKIKTERSSIESQQILQTPKKTRKTPEKHTPTVQFMKPEEDEDAEERVESDNESNDSNSKDGSSSSEEEEEEEEASVAPKVQEKKKTQIKAGKKPIQRQRRGGKSASSTAILALSRKVLSKEETQQVAGDEVSCLIASVILSSQPNKPESCLRDICSELVATYSSDPNLVLCLLLNFLFRSVGGSLNSNIDASSTSLDELDNDAWAVIVTDLVDEMRHTPLDHIAFFAEQSPSEGSPSVARIEYRSLYKKFWHTFASVAMEEGQMATNQNRFDTEVIRDVVLKIMELVGVGQPDVRCAATLALLQCGHAILDKTLVLGTKITTSSRQLSTPKSKKNTSLQNTIASLKRTQRTLEELVLQSVIQGVFVHRYRDSNPWIRSMCIDGLSGMTEQRPDIFLCDTYLKYFGWLMSDKDGSVRKAAVNGLLLPFGLEHVDLGVMENVVQKFLDRIADTVLDKEYGVQEEGMKLLLQLLRNGFLDDVDNEYLWNQVNLRAIARDTNAEVRKYALYFVMEQLEAFDEGEEEQIEETPKKRKAVNIVSESLERRLSLRLDALASWLAHALSDGPVPIENLQISLADLVVFSLREMPEHSNLATNWSALLRCITEDNIATLDGATAGDRVDVAKQRVLVQMFACAAKAEVGAVASADFLQIGVDAAMIPKSANLKSKDAGHTHESLSVAILTALPKLFLQFKTDSIILASLSSLPRYLIATVFSLPQRKNDFTALCKSLSTIFLTSTDEQVLNHTALSLSYLSQGDHSRVADVKKQLQNLTQELQSRSMELLAASVKGEDEITVSFVLLRFFIFSKRCDYILDFMGGDDMLLEVTNTIANGLADRLVICKDLFLRGEASALTDTVSAIDYGFRLLLCLVSWRLLHAQEEEVFSTDEEKEEEDYQEHICLLLRNQIIKLAEQALELYTPREDVDDEEMLEAMDSIQMTACRISSDLRILFPKIWGDAQSPLLRALGIKDGGKLIGGFVRFLHSKNAELHANDGESENKLVVYQLLLPFSRSLAANWNDGHRREAGVALSHITGSGEEAGAYVTVLSKMLKKMDPVRLLESHMACLRHSYDSWMFNEPEMESDRPTDEEMAAYEVAEQHHKEQFHSLEHQAARLSQSLGVGRLSDPKLSPALLGFIREGMRFSFSNKDTGSDEQDLVLGCRLSFLSIVAKYVNWIRRNRTQKETIGGDLDDRENALRTHQDFHEVHQDDLSTLASFRELLGFKPLSDSIPITPITTENEDEGESVMPQSIAESSMPGESLEDDDSAASKSSRRSVASSVRSSKVSVQTDLSPVLEERESSSPSTNQHYSFSAISPSGDSSLQEEDSHYVSRASSKRSVPQEDESQNISRASSKRTALEEDDSYNMSRASSKRSVPQEDESQNISRASSKRTALEEDDSYNMSRASSKRSVPQEDESQNISRASSKRTALEEDDSYNMSRASSKRSAGVNLTQSTYTPGRSQSTYAPRSQRDLTQSTYAPAGQSSIESDMISSPEASVPSTRPQRKRTRRS